MTRQDNESIHDNKLILNDRDSSPHMDDEDLSIQDDALLIDYNELTIIDDDEDDELTTEEYLYEPYDDHCDDDKPYIRLPYETLPFF